jgi:hypothetical protein
MRSDSGYKAPRVRWRTDAKPPKIYEGRFTLNDYDQKQAAEQVAAQPALEQNALMDFYIARHDAEKEQARLDELRKEEKRIARDKAREEQNARVEAQVAAAKAAKVVAAEKAKVEADKQAAFLEIDKALEACEATDQEISAVRQMLKANDDLLSKTAWVAGLLKLRTNDEGRMK